MTGTPLPRPILRPMKKYSWDQRLMIRTWWLMPHRGELALPGTAFGRGRS